MTLSCKFPSCAVQLKPEQAWVPEIQAIRQIIGKPVTAELLADHIFCGRHARLLREESKQNGKKVLVFSYTGTVAELERRERERTAERAAAKGLLNLYGAFKKAGLVDREAAHQPSQK